MAVCRPLALTTAFPRVVAAEDTALPWEGPGTYRLVQQLPRWFCHSHLEPRRSSAFLLGERYLSLKLGGRKWGIGFRLSEWRWLLLLSWGRTERVCQPVGWARLQAAVSYGGLACSGTCQCRDLCWRSCGFWSDLVLSCPRSQGRQGWLRGHLGGESNGPGQKRGTQLAMSADTATATDW